MKEKELHFCKVIGKWKKMASAAGASRIMQ